jgi:hypothetical protein
MMVRRLVIRAIPLVVLFSLAGCGVYTFNPRGKSDLNSIAVQRFDNKTAEYGLADRLTDEVIDAFISDGTFKVVPADGAEALLVGVLTRYERKPHTYDQNDEVQEYKVEMDFDVTLKNPGDDSDIWTEKMNQYGVYAVETETEEDAQRKVIALLVETIINRTTKSW